MISAFQSRSRKPFSLLEPLRSSTHTHTHTHTHTRTCMWNQKVNAFLQDIHPIPVSLPLWQPTSSSRHSTLPASLTLASASSVPLSSSSLKPRKEQRKEKSKKDMKKDTSSDDEWEYHGMKKQRNHSLPSPPSLPASSLDTRAPSSEPTPKEYQCPLCPFTCTAYIGLFGHQRSPKTLLRLDLSLTEAEATSTLLSSIRK